MKTFVNQKLRCVFLRKPNKKQTRQIIELYRAQGWWHAGDNGREQLVARLVAGSHCFAIAIDEKDIIGMGRAISDGISDAYIQDLTVRLDRRKEGIGKLILHEILEHLHADGITWIGLIAEQGSGPLYRQAGFQKMSGAIPMLMIKKQ